VQPAPIVVWPVMLTWETSRVPAPIVTLAPTKQNGPIVTSGAIRAPSSTLAAGSIPISPLVATAVSPAFERVYASSVGTGGHELLRMMTSETGVQAPSIALTSASATSVSPTRASPRYHHMLRRWAILVM
jgi:hypothetical protein